MRQTVRKFWALSLLLASLLLAACDLPESPASLAGEWKLRYGFSEEFLRDEAMTDPAWQTVRVPMNVLPRDDWDEYRGWVTLRRELPVGAVRPFWLDGRVGMFSGWVSDIGYLYFNEERFGTVGQLEPYEPGFSRFFLGPVEATPASVSDRNFITIALFASERFPASLWDVNIAMGDLQGVYFDFYFREILALGFIAVYLTVGVYHLLLFRWRPAELYNLYFGAFTTVVSMYWLHRSNLRNYLYGDYQLVRYKFEIVLLFAAGPLLIFFLSHLFRRRYDRVGLVLAAFCGLLAVAALFPGFVGTTDVLRVWQYGVIPVLLYMCFYIIREARAGNRDARYLTIGLLVLVAAIFHDLFSAMGWIDGVVLSTYAFFLFIVGIAIILGHRFMNLHDEVEELNTGLEEKVRDRTRKLENSLSEIRELKEQQDGDYFLTSLLLRPLSKNTVRSSVVSVDHLTRQAKQFHFRRWTAEIGGDLTASDVVVLRGRRYVAVLNGDAMGKSIQGAGGALVLGTAFKSLLDRTRDQSELRRLDPELWLKQCFDELQNVFAAFDGTMLVSLVAGLVDEESGLFYYINAEHPFVVLYRDDRADFIERHVRFRKVGITGLSGGMIIRTFPLKRGDVLILGSDGRDDLLLGHDERGQRIINENEQEFLRRVEEAHGDLLELEKHLLRWGTLTDDLSVVRVGYREDAALEADAEPPPLQDLLDAGQKLADANKAEDAIREWEAARRLAPDHAPLIKNLAGQYQKAGQLDRALTLGRHYNTLAPEDTDWLFGLASLSVELGDDREAVRFAERMRLREPEHLENLALLMEACVRLGRLDRAAKFLERILLLDAQHAGALRLRDTLAGHAEPGDTSL